MNNNNADFRFLELVIKAYEGHISPEEIRVLNDSIQTNPEAATCYAEFFDVVSGLIDIGDHGRSSSDGQTGELDFYLQELAEYERTAPSIEIPREEPAKELIQKVVYPPREKRKVSKFSIAFFAMSAAALFFAIIYVRFAPVRTAPLVGKLTRTVAAQWQDASGQITQGCDLYAGPMDLTGGYAEIVLDGGAVIAVQAPAQFALESTQQFYLQQGRVVARKKGGGEQAFLIRTPHASVVDYGTEFGVNVDSAGQTETYVYEGQVQLRDSSNPVKFKESLLLSAGQGALADTESNLRSKQVDPKAFVRPDELETRYLAQKDEGYYRWKASIYRLHRDPSLVAHYFFEKSKDNPQWLINSAFPDRQGMRGTFGDAGKGTPTWVQGRWPQKDAVRFERAQKQGIVIPPDEAFSFTRPLTISTWFYFPNADQWGGHLISCRDNGYVNFQFSLFDKNYAYKSQRNRFEFLQYNEGGSPAGIYSHPFIPESGRWYHAAVVYDGSEVRFYVNGKLFQAAAHKGISEATSAEIIIGAIKMKDKYTLETGDFDGVVDELMVFNRELTEQEIREIYDAGKPG